MGVARAGADQEVIRQVGYVRDLQQLDVQALLFLQSLRRQHSDFIRCHHGDLSFSLSWSLGLGAADCQIPLCQGHVVWVEGFIDDF